MRIIAAMNRNGVISGQRDVAEHLPESWRRRSARAF
jgi:hypothetical protein